MKKILFVDDEPAILEGLQDSLRKHKRYWEMTFACGGEAAIAELSSQRYDVVVSDIRMPGINGVSVLEHAKRCHPKTTRIALTGYSDPENTIKLTSLAQSYLTKPCDIDELELAISRDSGLIEAFDNPIVKDLAGRGGRLPGLDAKQQALLSLLNDGDASVGDIAAIVERDIALTAKLLQLANSSFFRRQKSIDSARYAVSYLGVDVIRSLVLANQLFKMTESMPSTEYFDALDLQQHSLLTATIAREICPIEDLASTCYTAGLLHDVGKIIIAIEKPELLTDLVGAQPSRSKMWVHTSQEREILGCTHAEVGGFFLDLWRLPAEVVEAVTFHDTPDAVFSNCFDTVGSIHVANYLSHWARSGGEGEQLENYLDRDYLSTLGVLDREAQWKEQALDIFNQLKDEMQPSASPGAQGHKAA